MSAMTEEQAREKWCPFVRLAVDPKGPFLASNRVESTADFLKVGEDTEFNSRCLASDCMAWRWEYEYARTEKESKLRPGDPDLDNQGWEMLSESSDQKYWRRRVGGFCGLAEPRVVDVEITQ